MEDMEVVSWDDPLGEYTKTVLSEFHKIPANFWGATSATWKWASSMSTQSKGRTKRSALHSEALAVSPLRNSGCREVGSWDTVDFPMIRA